MRYTSTRRGIDRPDQPRTNTRARRPIRLAAGLIVALVAVVGSSDSLAQAPPDLSSWIGERVVTRLGAILQVDGKPVDDDGRGKDEARCRVYKVERVGGRLLWLVAEDSRIKGWAQAADVVRLDEAVAYITGLIRADPTAAANYVWRGNIQHARYDYDKAIADFTDAIRLDPTSATAYSFRGRVWYHKKDYDKAVADFTEEIRLDPTSADAHTRRGHALRDKSDDGKAIADFTEAIRLASGAVDAYIRRGLVLKDKKDNDKAIADINEVIRLDVEEAEAYLRSRKAGSNTKDYNQAPGDVAEEIRPGPTFAGAYISRGLVWGTKKDYDKAISDFNEAIRLDPRSKAAYFSRGLVWQNKKDYAKAINDFNEAIRLDPGYALAYDARAWIWATTTDDKVRDGKRAVESATRACEINGWKTAYDLGVLAAAYAEVGDFDAAVQSQEKATTLLDAKNDAALAVARTQLDLYRNKKPYRQDSNP